MRRVGFPDAFRGIEPIMFYPVSDPVPAIFLGRGRWKGGGALHTYVDDYRQEFFWRRPEEGRLVAQLARVVTAPDFTVWDDDPETMRRYQAWRSALVGAYWRQGGVKVLPVISFRSGIADYVNPGSTWSIRGPSARSEAFWIRSLGEFLENATVGRLVVFGRAIDWLDTLGLPVERRRLQPVARDA